MLYVLSFILAILCAVGLSELFRLILDRIYEKTEVGHQIVILPLRGEIHDLEFRLKQVDARNRHRLETSYQVYLLDLGLNDESRNIIRLLQKDIDGIILCEEGDLSAEIRKNLRLQSI